MSLLFKNVIKYICLLSFLIILPFGAINLSAQNDMRGVIISPAKQELELKPGDSNIINIDLSNDSSESDLTIRTSLQTFTRGEGGRPLLRAFESGEKHKDWLALPSSFPLNKGGKQSVQIAIQVPIDAVPGGYLYAVTFNISQKDQTVVTRDSVRVERNIAALLFLTVSGESKKNLEISSLQASPWLVDPFFDDLKIDWEFKNDSEKNFITPRGNLIIYQFEDSPILLDQVNPDSSTILEQSSRTFSAIQEGVWDTVISGKISKSEDTRLLDKNRPWLGSATVMINYSYIDGANTPVSKNSSTNVLFFPWKLLLIVILIIALLASVIYWIKKLRLLKGFKIKDLSTGKKTKLAK